MQHSTTYIIGFSTLVCVVCALFVATAEVSLRPLKELNIQIDRQKNILGVAGLIKAGEKVDTEKIRELFQTSIRPKIIDLATGEENTTLDPETFNQRAAAKDPAQSTSAAPNPSKVLRVPNQALIYEVLSGEEVKSIIIPIEGYGLWSVLYGYLALTPDTRTILGITYYEQIQIGRRSGLAERLSTNAGALRLRFERGRPVRPMRIRIRSTACRERPLQAAA